ncbi:capsular polysaccharide synthesis protein [Sodalis sp. C49]|uniref:capsular polysaccharide synthesis protein n=1 Tax=Sodalis sp. C49 TaxID=3228929 RepID=UPI003965905E
MRLKLIKFVSKIITIILKFVKKINSKKSNFFGHKLNELKNRLIAKKLKSEHGLLISKYSNFTNNYDDAVKLTNVWVCWFQGQDNAPYIVQRCIDSIRSSVRGLDVIIITDENFSLYTNLPEHIISKYKRGIITKTHFSDILRAELLSTNGGIWLDATLLCLKPLPEEFFKSSFFTLKSNTVQDFITISNGKWAGYCMSSNRNNKLLSFLRDFLFEYWMFHDGMIDYFLIDYIIKIAYDSFDDVRNEIDIMPAYGDNRHMLDSLLSKEFNEKDNEKITNDKIKIYKLSYKKNYIITIDPTRKRTFYDYYLK